LKYEYVLVLDKYSFLIHLDSISIFLMLSNTNDNFLIFSLLVIM